MVADSLRAPRSQRSRAVACSCLGTCTTVSCESQCLEKRILYCTGRTPMLTVCLSYSVLLPVCHLNLTSQETVPCVPHDDSAPEIWLKDRLWGT
jgi:hypothetical protein